jgi:glucokinase
MSCQSEKRECYLGIDIGKTRIKAGMVSEDGRVFAQRHQNVECRDLDSLTQQLTAILEQLGQADSSSCLKGVGMGVPALISKDRSHVSLSLPMPYLNGVNFREHMSTVFGLPVAMDNDANVAAYGEMLLGAAQDCENFIYVNVGSRVCASLVIHRQIFRGSSGFAGELGHVSLDPDGKKCSCGSMGCLERYISASSVSQRVVERLSLNPSSALQIITDRPVTAQDVTAAAIVGDKMAGVIINEVGRYLGVALSNLIDLLNVELIILGGGLAEAGDILVQPALEEVKRRSLAPPYDDCRIVTSALGPAAGLVGAALFARDQFSAS